MLKVTDIQGDHVARVFVAGQSTASTADEWAVFRAPANCVVTAARWIPNAAVTGANTNNFALAVRNRGAAGAGTTAVTTTKTYASGTDSVAFAAETLTLTSTAADLNVTAGDVISLIRTINGTGLAMPDGTVEVSFRIR